MKVAAIDLGTNSFLCLIAEADQRGIHRVLSDDLRIVRLGEGVHSTRRFSEGALKRAEEAFRFFKDQMDRFGVQNVQAVATSAARDVSNGMDLLRLGERFGIPIEIIHGTEEARLTFEGAVGGSGDSPGTAVVDVGGGSTELIHEWHDSKIHSVSWDIGCVRLTEIHVKQDPPGPKCLEGIFRQAHETIHTLIEESPERLIAVAGTPTTLAAMDQEIEFDPNRIDGFRLTKPLLDKWIERLGGLTVGERKKLRGLDPGRADVVLAGAIILRVVLERLDLFEMEVSTKGLRYGLAAEMGAGKK